jgi:hypothetical protein
MADPAPSPRQRLGRRAALVVYWVVVVSISVAAAVSVTLQVFAAPPGPRFASCEDGLRALAAGVDRARAAAAASEGNEDEAIARFRGALDPDWSGLEGVASSCRGKAENERALDALERLRYAEEHAVRRESGELAPLRRRVQAVVDALPPQPAQTPRP